VDLVWFGLVLRVWVVVVVVVVVVVERYARTHARTPACIHACMHAPSSSSSSEQHQHQQQKVDDGARGIQMEIEGDESEEVLLKRLRGARMTALGYSLANPNTQMANGCVCACVMHTLSIQWLSLRTKHVQLARS